MGILGYLCRYQSIPCGYRDGYVDKRMNQANIQKLMWILRVFVDNRVFCVDIVLVWESERLIWLVCSLCGYNAYVQCVDIKLVRI